MPQPCAIKCPSCNATGVTAAPATTALVTTTCHTCSGIGWLRTPATV